MISKKDTEKILKTIVNGWEEKISIPKTKNIKVFEIEENKNINTLELLGIMISFNNNFKPSARGCNNPKKPTIFGPLRL